MVLAFAGDSTITSRPRPGPGEATFDFVFDLGFGDEFEVFAAALRGFADGDSSMMS